MIQGLDTIQYKSSAESGVIILSFLKYFLVFIIRRFDIWSLHKLILVRRLVLIPGKSAGWKVKRQIAQSLTNLFLTLHFICIFKLQLS